MAYADKKRESQYMTQYMKDKYDRVQILRNKGDKAKLKAIAESRGMSTNVMLNNIVDEWLAKNGYSLD